MQFVPGEFINALPPMEASPRGEKKNMRIGKTTTIAIAVTAGWLRGHGINVAH